MKTHQKSQLETLAMRFAQDIEGIVRDDLYRKLNQATAKKAPPAAPGKRSSEALDRICRSILVALAAKSNIGVEELASLHDCDSRELVLPLRKLRMQKKITVKGQKRATRYALAR